MDGRGRAPQLDGRIITKCTDERELGSLMPLSSRDPDARKRLRACSWHNSNLTLSKGIARRSQIPDRRIAGTGTADVKPREEAGSPCPICRCPPDR